MSASLPKLILLFSLVALVSGCSSTSGPKGGTPTKTVIRDVTQKKLCFDEHPEWGCLQLDEATGTMVIGAESDNRKWFNRLRRDDGSLIESMEPGGELLVISPTIYARRRAGHTAWQLVGTTGDAKPVQTRFAQIYAPFAESDPGTYLRLNASALGSGTPDGFSTHLSDYTGWSVTVHGPISVIGPDAGFRWSASDVAFAHPGPEGWALTHGDAARPEAPQTHTILDRDGNPVGPERSTSYAAFVAVAPALRDEGVSAPHVRMFRLGHRLLLAEKLPASGYRLVFPRAGPRFADGKRGAYPLLRTYNNWSVAATNGHPSDTLEHPDKPAPCQDHKPTACTAGLVGWEVPDESGNGYRLADPQFRWQTPVSYARIRWVRSDGALPAEAAVAITESRSAELLRASFSYEGVVRFTAAAPPYPNESAAIQTINALVTDLYGRRYQRQMDRYNRQVAEYQAWENQQRFKAQAEGMSTAAVCGAVEAKRVSGEDQRKAWTEVCNSRLVSEAAARQKAIQDAQILDLQRRMEAAAARQGQGNGAAIQGSSATPGYDPTQSQRNLQQIDRNLNAIKDPNRNGAAGAAQRY
ncbi:MAG: hypothetical protein WCJ69_17330 [Betaproteobacteria bacterium]